MRALAQELVGLQPDIIVTNGTTPGTIAVQRETQTIPIVFATLGDPVASGIVARLDRSLKVVPTIAPTYSDAEIETAIAVTVTRGEGSFTPTSRHSRGKPGLPPWAQPV
jgi:ABC-type uncharacterized transport system substrate-binding protein